MSGTSRRRELEREVRRGRAGTRSCARSRRRARAAARRMRSSSSDLTRSRSATDLVAAVRPPRPAFARSRWVETELEQLERACERCCGLRANASFWYSTREGRRRRAAGTSGTRAGCATWRHVSPARHDEPVERVGLGLAAPDGRDRLRHALAAVRPGRAASRSRRARRSRAGTSRRRRFSGWAPPRRPSGRGARGSGRKSDRTTLPPVL